MLCKDNNFVIPFILLLIDHRLGENSPDDLFKSDETVIFYFSGLILQRLHGTRYFNRQTTATSPWIKKKTKSYI